MVVKFLKAYEKVDAVGAESYSPFKMFSGK